MQSSPVAGNQETAHGRLANATRHVATALAIPVDASLLGLQIRQQVAPFETSLAGAVTAITATNGLLLTIGTL